MRETEKIVREELGKILDKDTSQISIDANLIEDVGMDSLNVLEIFGMVEEKFNVVVDTDKISELKTIGDIVEIIEENKK
ncbi:MAG: acyl carrier protein [Clostridia bacterium]|nr:acyl carrier protein [Clostridia bacterium]